MNKDSINSDSETIEFNVNHCDYFDCFSKKLKKLKNNFGNVKFDVKKQSLDFKFNFYKSLIDCDFNNKMNTNFNELICLKDFLVKKPFKILDCDKNIGICFVDNDKYKEFVELNLNDHNTYLKLDFNPLNETIRKITNCINDLIKAKLISKNLAKQIVLIKDKCKIGTFRLLAKLHKKKLGFRPIINCRSHPTSFLCLLVDCILQPFVKNSESYIQDSQHLIQKSLQKTFPLNSKLYSCDFESLYTNINLNHALMIITEFIGNNFVSSSLETMGFYHILKLIFDNNIFTFNNVYYVQIAGIAMGSKCGPSIANVYIFLLEKSFLFIHKPLFYYRFIDDIFVILELDFDINILINHFDYLKLKCETDLIVNFLDLNISLDVITGFLNFSLYSKPTNTFSFLLFSSNHPSSIKSNIPKSLFIRLRRINSKYSDFLFYARKLIRQLVNRGYDFKQLIKISNMVSNINRNDILPYKEKNLNFDKDIIYFKFPFDMNISEIKLSFNSAFNSISDTDFIKNSEFRVINSMQTNLNSLFVHEIRLFGLKKYRFINCLNSSCSICFYSNNNHYLELNNFYLPIQSLSTCNSVSVIYIIRCKLCEFIYIGQSNKLKNRLKTHIKGCLLNIESFSSNICVVQHFNKSCHSTSRDLEFFVYKSDICNKWARLNLETQLIHLAIKLNVKLMNVLIPDPYYWKRSDKLFDLV